MAKSPVRRALFILFIAAAIIAMLLMFAQDQVTLKVRSAAGAEEPAARRRTSRRWSAGDLTYGNDYDVLTNGDQIFPPMLEAIQARRSGASASKPTSTRPASVADQFTAALEEAARRGVRVNMVVDSVGASGMKDEDVQRLEERRMPHRAVQLADVVLARRGQLPHPPQDPRRRRRDRVHRRRRVSPTTGSGTRRTRSTGATRRSGCAGRSSGCSRPASTRTSSRPPARSRRSSTTSSRELHDGGRSDGGAQLADRRQQRSEAALPAGDRLRAPHARHHDAVLRHRRIERLGVQRRRRARRQDPHPRRRGHHRRDAGEVRVARGLRPAAASWASRSTNTSRR